MGTLATIASLAGAWLLLRRGIGQRFISDRIGFLLATYGLTNILTSTAVAGWIIGLLNSTAAVIGALIGKWQPIYGNAVATHGVAIVGWISVMWIFFAMLSHKWTMFGDAATIRFTEGTAWLNAALVACVIPSLHGPWGGTVLSLRDSSNSIVGTTLMALVTQLFGGGA